MNVFKSLDEWIEKENAERKRHASIQLKKATVYVLGQTALLEAKLGLELLSTADVDALIDAEYIIRKKFDDLLKVYNRYLDPDSEKVWMPEETKYRSFYKGKFVVGLLAHHDYVLVSKALKAAEKNRNLITAYLAQGASREFLRLSKKYKLDLERFV